MLKEFKLNEHAEDNRIYQGIIEEYYPKYKNGWIIVQRPVGHGYDHVQFRPLDKSIRFTWNKKYQIYLKDVNDAPQKNEIVNFKVNKSNYKWYAQDIQRNINCGLLFIDPRDANTHLWDYGYTKSAIGKFFDGYCRKHQFFFPPQDIIHFLFLYSIGDKSFDLCCMDDIKRGTLELDFTENYNSKAYPEQITNNLINWLCNPEHMVEIRGSKRLNFEEIFLQRRIDRIYFSFNIYVNVDFNELKVFVRGIPKRDPIMDQLKIERIMKECGEHVRIMLYRQYWSNEEQDEGKSIHNIKRDDIFNILNDESIIEWCIEEEFDSDGIGDDIEFETYDRLYQPNDTPDESKHISNICKMMDENSYTFLEMYFINQANVEKYGFYFNGDSRPYEPMVLDVCDTYNKPTIWPIIQEPTLRQRWEVNQQKKKVKSTIVQPPVCIY